MASFIEAFADRLDLPPEQARRSLGKLVDALRARTDEGERAALPGIGTFQKEDAGGLSFEPADALSRAVNHSFADLQPVGVSASQQAPADESLFDVPDAEDSGAEASSAEDRQPSPPPTAPPEEPPPEADDEPPAEKSPSFEEAAPSSGASIFDRSEEDEAQGEPVRGLFTPEEEPSAAPGEAGDEPAAPPEEEPVLDDEASEDIWPFPNTESEQQTEDVPASPSSVASQYAALPAAFLVHRYATPSPEALGTGRLEAFAPSTLTPTALRPAPSEAPASGGSQRADDRPPSSPDDDAAGEEGARRMSAREKRRAERQSERQERGGSPSWARWGLAALAALLVLGAAWFFLSQPSGSGEAPPADEPVAEQPAETTPDPSSAGAAGGSSGEENDGSEGNNGSAASPAEQAFDQAPRLDRSQGGWTIVVSSETSRAEARRAAGRFAQRFQGSDTPVDIVEATVDGTQRYRVVVGQYPSGNRLMQALDGDSQNRFPEDAWGLELGT